jgi:Arc/MetJ-type ribon-helix-helix transcriptional regulator
MTIELKPEQERIIQEQIASGRFGSVEEVLKTALSKLHHGGRQPRDSGSDAVRRMIDFAKNRSVKLPPGEKVKDLVHEGHRY